MDDVIDMDGPRGYMPPQLSPLEQQIIGDWGDRGLPNIEAIHELACDMLYLAIMDLGDPPHPRAIAPDEDQLSQELFRMLDGIPCENSALDVLHRIHDFVAANAKYRDPTWD